MIPFIGAGNWSPDAHEENTEDVGVEVETADEVGVGVEISGALVWAQIGAFPVFQNRRPSLRIGQCV
jgi:hypothetical protein